MACSKILLGDLPELTYDIIQYFRDDIPTLRSCILVNRFWCQTAIPLLWKDPFSIKNPKNFHFIEIYLHKINEEDKTQLNRCGINNNVFPSKTLFNYSNFIKCINTRNMCSIIVNWIKINKKFTCSKGRIFLLLINVFIENEAKLHTFEIEISFNYLMSRKFFNSIFKLILQNPKFISNIKNLKLHFNEEIIKYKFDYNFLKCFYYHCNLISSLHIRFSNYESFSNNYMTIKNQLSQITNSQKNLQKFIFSHFPFSENNIRLDNIICGSNSSKHLKIIIFYKIDFKNILHIKEAFEQLNVLESIHILECLIFNSSFIQQIIDVNKPFKLVSLFMRKEDDHRSRDEDRNLQIESIRLLFQKFGEYLENIGFISNVGVLKYRVLELINNYCKRIKFFDIYTSSIQKAHNILDSVKIFVQNLNYLSIYFYFPYDEKNESTIELFLRLTHVLPCKLEFLNLSFSGKITKNAWEVFLKNLKNIFVKKLLFETSMLVLADILPYIKEYIMKEKRAEYLAIASIHTNRNRCQCQKELFNMADELKEFESYNIKVKEYYNLFIKAYEFIDEMY
ncbi:hypothetical protein RhiirC2_787189 [Rhizophagus irregularis]|uniref:F-box domain-containing protein n=1 Tax=Rhizophagus irregularis TaxID=588596 RepID=A0A2N1MSP5_9GLOM|nr:hypothetical protein RhiirC2_787189 [Rhizophagus irregularis]